MAGYRLTLVLGIVFAGADIKIQTKLQSTGGRSSLQSGPDTSNITHTGSFVLIHVAPGRRHRTDSFYPLPPLHG